jgi:hypothetical protein
VVGDYNAHASLGLLGEATQLGFCKAEADGFFGGELRDS